ncbi:CLUMA_CG001466, isoform A [Clunio marinus]|uniref:CLUMA_CG001466, isoform A n=1 Tax=Clunio marinus TaxID=568069 RepID=A0A1J1HN61_9DIPT|nr:CLUMA_CG001466, isoform A [Clunio marinus]
MTLKVFFFIPLLLAIVSMCFAVEKVAIPDECAQSCPPTGQQLCAKNTVTQQLGVFDSDCIFGRYNSCTKIAQKYEFVRYGDCSTDNV